MTNKDYVVVNELIGELAKQAHKDVIKNTPSFLVTKELYEQKFAQLIVEKCAGIIESQDVDPAFKHRMSWAVKEHFGVEE